MVTVVVFVVVVVLVWVGIEVVMVVLVMVVVVVVVVVHDPSLRHACRYPEFENALLFAHSVPNEMACLVQSVRLPVSSNMSAINVDAKNAETIC